MAKFLYNTGIGNALPYADLTMVGTGTNFMSWLLSGVGASRAFRPSDVLLGNIDDIGSIPLDTMSSILREGASAVLLRKQPVLEVEESLHYLGSSANISYLWTDPADSLQYRVDVLVMPIIPGTIATHWGRTVRSNRGPESYWSHEMEIGDFTDDSQRVNVTRR